ncbi:hypothetical protein LEP1GSC058_2985 [Leptospira fainei serovar Hurstbridge str. BUT 6]|uniref:Uncharacterized protein n=1 Tax=Leptospira fainei serovar Hurstbridge str. BUT 6 TaxID=1193011 RepID=S3UZ00_9LEPT|nr:hypothetical protein LEP1GSC058_2985 [Leptospira fainei serovar Hurstbridge str. BUT 6]
MNCYGNVPLVKRGQIGKWIVTGKEPNYSQVRLKRKIRENPEDPRK